MTEPSSNPQRRITVPDFRQAKGSGHKLAVLTAYDWLTATILDETGVDALLVGDTLGMVVQGNESTLPVTLEQMIYHGEMVARAARRALVIVDLPFMTYQVGPRQAVRNAGRVIKETGAAAVKLESGATQARTIEALASVDLQVMAHVGMRPQSIRKYGRMSAIQRDAKQLLQDARAAESAGAFAIVLELIPRGIARDITAELSIPTIGIGAGPDCDGQVLVTPDMLGLTAGFNPKYLKRYAELREQMIAAARDYVGEVRSGAFPDDAHSHT
jgi:3-methyl-2-oxobutanoate hydroxymethyltransferase